MASSTVVASASTSASAAAAIDDGGECPICAEAFTAVLRARKECAFCHAPACKQCVERYLLSTLEDPHCMSCKQPWSPECIDGMLTRAFRTGKLKEHRENVLIDRERSMLPATQPEVERILEEARIRKQIAEVEKQREELTVQIRLLGRQLHAMWARGRAAGGGWNAEGGGGDDGGGASNAEERRKFVKPCVVEGCRGFLSTAYKCGLCQTNVCPKCHEVKRAGEAHTCVPETVQSVALISGDSKACPKCGAMIFRVSGCSQMFCTAPGCATAFEWHTGRIVTSRIHNPHYYEFMRQRRAEGGGVMGREAGDIPCGGLPTARELQALRTLTADNRLLVKYNTLMRAHRVTTHVLEVELRYNYPAIEAPTFETNKDLRVKYLMGTLDADQMKRTLQAREKRRHKMSAINQVLAMLGNVASDIFRALVISGCTMEAAESSLAQLNALREYVNSSLLAVRHRFQCVVPQLTDEWGLTKSS